MLFSVLMVIVGLNSLNAQIFFDEFKLTKSQDVTRLSVEYYKNNDALQGNSLTYSLWKGKLKYLQSK